MAQAGQENWTVAARLLKTRISWCRLFFWLFGGMGSLNDILFSTKALFETEENERFAALRKKLGASQSDCGARWIAERSDGKLTYGCT